MSFSNLHWPAVLGATFAAFVAGALWFGPRTFFPVWWKAMGFPPDRKPGEGMNMAVVFGSTFMGQFTQALTMALIVDVARRASGGAFGAADGALVGLVVGAGIAAAASLSHRLFAGHGFKVWMIEVGSDVVNIVLMGTILGAWTAAP